MYELCGNVDENHGDIKPIIRFPERILKYLCQFLAVVQQNKSGLIHSLLRFLDYTHTHTHIHTHSVGLL